MSNSAKSTTKLILQYYMRYFSCWYILIILFITACTVFTIYGISLIIFKLIFDVKTSQHKLIYIHYLNK